MGEKHAKEMQDLESANNQKLMLEYERQMQEREEDRERSLEELTEYYETKLQESTTQLNQAHDEARQQSQEYEETKKQIEEDGDREILDIKNTFEKKLREEREANMKLKGETGIMRKKFTSLQKE